jgi:ATP-dependent RNA helicase RhlE
MIGPMAFSQFPLHPKLQEAVKAMGFTAPMPIQQMAIPPALEGRDVLGSAQTGSGKTVAFALPLLNKILAARERAPHAKGGNCVRAMILVPTRELAAQVETCLHDLTRFEAVPCALIMGGVSFHNQTQLLRKGAEVVVATPGRLLDHVRQRTLNLSQVHTAVLDEADRMLDMGFMPDVRRIMQLLPKDRQTLMFSATIPPEVERVIKEFQNDPVRIAIDRPSSPAAGISQAVYPITIDQKYDLLVAILKNVQVTSAVIFARTKDGADRVARTIQNAGLKAAVMHSNKTQAQRTQTMDAFREGKHHILVATDLVARGIDVEHISHVINFDVPQHPEDYVHRIGRTGRAFKVGDAITLMTFDEQRYITAIESFIGQTIPRAALPDFPYRVQPLLQAYKPPKSSGFGRLRRSIPRGRGRF